MNMENIKRSPEYFGVYFELRGIWYCPQCECVDIISVDIRDFPKRPVICQNSKCSATEGFEFIMWMISRVGCNKDINDAKKLRGSK